MAKDDYDVVVFKISTYLYACMKRKIFFGVDTFNATISMKNINEAFPAPPSCIFRLPKTFLHQKC